MSLGPVVLQAPFAGFFFLLLTYKIINEVKVVFVILSCGPLTSGSSWARARLKSTRHTLRKGLIPDNTAQWR